MSVRKELDQAKETGWVQALAYSTATFLRQYGEHPGVIEIWQAAGMSIAQCNRHDVADYDMETIEKHKEWLSGSKQTKTDSPQYGC
jgi:hypothetical protein